MATGVLVVCVGQATRVVEYLMGAPKQYRAEVLLGATTTTDDLAGEITTRSDVSSVTREDVESLLPRFIGRIRQRPPVYSALKIDGRPLYRLARQGKAPEPEEREIDVYGLMVTDWSPPRFGLIVECGRGTYVRSLARDIGAALGVGGCLAALERTRVGLYRLEDSLSLDDVARRAEAGEAARIIRPIDEALADLVALRADAEGERRLVTGATWRLTSPPPAASPLPLETREPGSEANAPYVVARKPGTEIPVGEATPRPSQVARPVETTSRCRVYSMDGRLIAIADLDPRTGVLQPVTTFRATTAPPDSQPANSE
jgi:tRNA pseudouridine55 synthase